MSYLDKLLEGAAGITLENNGTPLPTPVETVNITTGTATYDAGTQTHTIDTSGGGTAAANTVFWANGSSVKQWTASPVLTNLVLSGYATAQNYVGVGYTSLPTVGAIRLMNNASITWRNAADNGNVIALKVDAGNNVILGGAIFPSAPLVGDIGKLLAVSAAGAYSVKSLSDLGILSSTTSIVFGVGITIPQISQTSITGSGSANALGIVAQGTDQSVLATGNGGDLWISATKRGGAGTGVDGQVNIAIEALGGAPTSGHLMAEVQSANTASQSVYTWRHRSDLILHETPLTGDHHCLSRASGANIKEDIQWLPSGTGQTTTSSTTPFSVDIVKFPAGSLDSPAIPDGKTYTIEYLIQAKGGTTASASLICTFYKSSGALSYNGDLVAIANYASITFANSAPDANTMRLTITPLNSASTTWTIKAKILQA